MADDAELEYSEASDDDEANSKDEMTSIAKAKELSKRKNNLEQKHYELKMLLAQPLTQQGFSGKYPTMSGQLNLPKQFQGSREESAIKRLEKDNKSINKIKNRRKKKKNKSN